MKKKLLLVCFLILAVTSCSRLDLAVNLANSYLTNKTDDYFNLTRDQKKWLKGALERNITKVKKTILPQLATEMLKAADAINSQKNFDGNSVLLTYERLENLLYQVLRLFSADAVLFADQLNPDQVVTFQNEFDKKMKELKYDDQQKKSYDRIKKQFDSWMGNMTGAQKSELKKFVAANPPPINETIYQRQSLAHDFVRTYPDKIARKKYVEKLFTHYDSMRDPNYIKIIKAKNKKVAEFVASVLSKMSSEQKTTLIETLRDRANQLFKISKG
jgi:hypothetical protein